MNRNYAWLRRNGLAALFWALFGAGLLVQVFSPHLAVKDHAFVIPQELVSGGKDIHPAEIIARQRRLQWLSVILTVGGALGLGFYYRSVLVRPRST
jgi:hypothetical protein